MPRILYKLKDGTRVPGVTSIIAKFEIEGLLVWANRMGQEGKNHRDVSEKATTIGSLCHAMVDAHLNGKPGMSVVTDENIDIIAGAQKGFGAFSRWAKQSNFEVQQTELNLISEEYKYGGTPDGIALADGALVVADWKTSKRIYSDYIIQVSGYRHLIDENGLGPIEGACIVRFGKDYGNFSHLDITSPMLDIGWEQFKDFRRAYERNKLLRKMVG